MAGTTIVSRSNNRARERLQPAQIDTALAALPRLTDNLHNCLLLGPGAKVPNRAEGSLWGKWDLHFHTPSSYDYENKSITNEQIVSCLGAAGVTAVAITDHHFIDVQRVRELQQLAGSTLTFFPGIELRSELGGRESVHLIGIFPEDSDPEFLWTKLQGPLSLTETEVTRKGHDNVYVRFEEAAELIHTLSGVVSVHVGRKSNSIENIGN